MAHQRPPERSSSDGTSQAKRTAALLGWSALHDDLSSPESTRKAVRSALLGALGTALIGPLLAAWFTGEPFSLFFGLVVYCVGFLVLYAAALHNLTRPEPFVEQSRWVGWLAFFWLVTCVLGPAFGWMLTNGFTTEANWRWLYGARVALAVVLPVLFVLPLAFRYARHRDRWGLLGLLLCITLLSASSAVNFALDLRDGPQQWFEPAGYKELGPCRSLSVIPRSCWLAEAGNHQEWRLVHTQFDLDEEQVDGESTAP